MRIRSAGLTTCGVIEAGKGVTLGLVDEHGADISLQLSFDQAQAVAMTLPRLLTQALRSITQDKAARYVFSLDAWHVERSTECDGLVLTLGTPDGFHVSFGVPAQTCRALGWTLAHEVKPTAEADASDDQQNAPARIALN
jgi:hypothetical protein